MGLRTRDDTPGEARVRARSVTGIALFTLLTAAGVSAGCGGGGETGSGGSKPTSTGGAGGTSGSTGTGGTGGGTTATVGKLTSAKPSGTDAAYALALDATLSADGSIVYFTGVGPEGPGVFSVPAGGGAVSKITAGGPLAAPVGIALSTDGKKLYIADPGAGGTASDHGRIFSVPAEGGAPTPIMGSDDTEPRGLDVVAENGMDQIYFSGSVNGEAGLYKLAAAGGTATALAKGAPFKDPSGVAVSKAGSIYVLDAVASKRSLGSIIEVKGSTATELVADIDVGFPSGIALGLDEKALFVSTVDKAKGGSSSLLVIDILSREPTRFPEDMSLAGKREPGGLHRAKDVHQFAWVSYDPAGGSVLVAK